MATPESARNTPPTPPVAPPPPALPDPTPESPALPRQPAQKLVGITPELAQALQTFLAKHPYKKVAHLIGGIQNSPLFDMEIAP